MSESPQIIDVERIVDDLRRRVAEQRAAGIYPDDPSELQLLPGERSTIRNGRPVTSQRVLFSPELNYPSPRRFLIGRIISFFRKIVLRLAFPALTDLAQQADLAVHYAFVRAGELEGQQLSTSEHERHVEQRLDLLTGRIDGLVASMGVLEQSKSDREELERELAALKEAQAELDPARQRAEAQLSALASGVEDLTVRAHALEETKPDRGELEQELAALKHAQAELDTARQHADEQLSALASRVAGLAARARTVEAVKVDRSAYQALEQDLATLELVQSELGTAKQKTEADIGALQRRIESLTGLVHRQQDSSADRSAYEGLKQELAALKEAKAKLDAAQQRADAQLSTLASGVEDLTVRVHALEETKPDRGELEQELAVLSEDLTTLEQELVALRAGSVDARD